MRSFPLIALILTLASCENGQNSYVAAGEKSNLLDTLRKESRGARLLFFKDFATSKTSILIKEAIDQKSLDTLLSFIGNEKRDTACDLFAEQNQAGEIYFYRDTAMTEILADVYLTLQGRCIGWYAGIDKNSKRFDITPAASMYLNQKQDEIGSFRKK